MRPRGGRAGIARKGGIVGQSMSLVLLLCMLVCMLLSSAPLAAEGPSIAQPWAKGPRHYRAPELIFDYPPELASAAELMQRQDPEGYLRIQRLLRLPDPGGPIYVRVVAEGSPQARLAPQWAVAYAIGSMSQVVMMPSRIPRYPDGDLLGVLRHEVAHVLVSRAADRRPLPRFFDEGVALYAAREWGLEDRGRVFLAAWPLSGRPLARLDEDFAGGADRAGQAYAISGAFVRYLIAEEGENVIARLLYEVAQGQDFESSFTRQVGMETFRYEARFWGDLDLWQKWMPLLSSSTLGWILITLLSVAAFERRRRRDAAQRELWLRQEAELGIPAMAVAPLSDEEDPAEDDDDNRPSFLH